jgi:hypothetical protein
LPKKQNQKYNYISGSVYILYGYSKTVGGSKYLGGRH